MCKRRCVVWKSHLSHGSAHQVNKNWFLGRRSGFAESWSSNGRRGGTRVNTVLFFKGLFYFLAFIVPVVSNIDLLYIVSFLVSLLDAVNFLYSF